VPGLQAQEVTIVDQRGVALTRIADTDAEAGSTGAARLELKREMENYLARKAAAVLEQAFGPGQALASVDLVLDMDQVRVTTEDVLAAPGAGGAAATGVLVRERESARDSATPESRGAEPRLARGSSMQRDVEYQAGRRVEQVVSQPGTVRRIQVVAVVRQALGAEQRDQVQKLLAAAVGASAERGDTVVVQALRAVPAQEAEAPAPPGPPASGAAADVPKRLVPWSIALAVGCLAALLLLTQAGRARQRPFASEPPRLTQAQREAALQQVRGWMLQASVPAASPPATPGRGRAP
jgi:flagellar M-ring protein FliF